MWILLQQKYPAFSQALIDAESCYCHDYHRRRHLVRRDLPRQRYPSQNQNPHRLRSRPHYHPPVHRPAALARFLRTTRPPLYLYHNPSRQGRYQQHHLPFRLGHSCRDNIPLVPPEFLPWIPPFLIRFWETPRREFLIHTHYQCRRSHDSFRFHFRRCCWRVHFGQIILDYLSWLF